MNDEPLSIREVAIKEAVQTSIAAAKGGYTWAAVCRASMNPEIEALAALYEQIGVVWERHAQLIMERSPLAAAAEGE